MEPLFDSMYRLFHKIISDWSDPETVLGGLSVCFFGLIVFGELGIGTADVAELGTLDDGFDGNGDAVVVLFQFFEHFSDEGFIGELDASAESIAEEFAAELVEDGVASDFDEVVAEAFQSAEFGAVAEDGEGIDGTSGVILFPETSDGVEGFE